MALLDVFQTLSVPLAAHHGVQGKVASFDHVSLRDNHRPLHGVFELPHIPGPVVRLERLHRLGTKPLDFLVHLAGVLLGEIADQ